MGPEAAVGAEGERRTPSALWVVLGLVLVAAGVRGIYCLVEPDVARDGATFALLAQEFNRGEYRRFFGLVGPHVAGNEESRDFEDFTGEEQRQHPLHPILVALTARLTGNAVPSAGPLGEGGVRGTIFAGRLLGVVLGSLLVVPVWLLTRRLFGARSALGAGWVVALQPLLIKAPAQMISETTYLFFFGMTLWLAYEAASRHSLPLVLAATVGATLAYYTRPEGIVLVALLAGAVLLWGIQRPRRRWGRRIAGVLAATLGWLVLALPYLLVIHHVLGMWWITMKKAPFFMRSLQGVQSAAPAGGLLPLAAVHLGTALADLLKTAGEAFHPLVVVLVLLGLVLRRKVRRVSGELFLGGAALLLLAMLLVFRGQAGYLSVRHLLPLMVVLVPFAGAALFELAALLSRWRGRVGVWMGVLLLITGATLAAKAFHKGLRTDLHLRAGQWIAGHCTAPGEPLRLMTAADSRIGFYAGAADRQFRLAWIARYERGHYDRPLTADLVDRWAVRQHPPVRWLVVQPRDLDVLGEGLLEQLDADPHFRRLDVIEARKPGENVIVYRIVP